MVWCEGRRLENEEGRGDEWGDGGEDGSSFDVEKSNSKMLKYSFSCRGDGVASSLAELLLGDAREIVHDGNKLALGLDESGKSFG
jgi:hypothetical protein